MESFANSGFKYRVIKVDIANWKTPVTQQFSINSVPQFRVYDGKKQLKAQGDAARSQVMKLIKK